MHSIIKKTLLPLVLAATAASIMPAFAQTGGLGAAVGISANATAAGIGARVGASISVKAQANIARIEDRADQEITRRENALNALSTKINTTVNISASDKANITATIQSQLQALSALEAKIGTDASSTATSSLKTDVASITDSYRIFMLVIPQGAIAGAVDRGMTVTSLLQTIGGKLQTRINAAQASGTDVTAMTSAYADFTSKLADAQTNLQSALSETASLEPDNGNQTVLTSNTAALKDAHAKIKAANQDFMAVRADAQTIIKALEASKVSAGASAAVAASTTATTP